MAHGNKCGLDCGSGTSIPNGSAVTVHTIPPAIPGSVRAHYIHLDLVNSGSGNTDITIVAGSLTFTLTVTAKALQSLDFMVMSTTSDVLVTANAAGADCFAIGFTERW